MYVFWLGILVSSCVATGIDITPLIDTVQDLSGDLLDMKLQLLEVERSVQRELGVAQLYLRQTLLSGVIPEYIGDQVNTSIIDALKSGSADGLLGRHVGQQMKAMAGQMIQLKNKLNKISDMCASDQKTSQIAEQTMIKDMFEAKFLEFSESMMSRFRRENRYIESRVDELEAKSEENSRRLAAVRGQQKTVAYQVKLTRDTSYRRYQGLKFDNVVLNTGTAYNKNTGVFTAPVSGMYLLWASIMRNNNSWLESRILRGEEILLRGYSTTGMHPHGVAHVTGVVHLQTGDEIKVVTKSNYASAPLRGDGFSSFGGMLISAK